MHVHVHVHAITCIVHHSTHVHVHSSHVSSLVAKLPVHTCTYVCVAMTLSQTLRHQPQDLGTWLGAGSLALRPILFLFRSEPQAVAITIFMYMYMYTPVGIWLLMYLTLYSLQDHDNQYNIIHMIEYFYFRNHLCITFELMG